MNEGMTEDKHALRQCCVNPAVLQRKRGINSRRSQENPNKNVHKNS